MPTTCDVCTSPIPRDTEPAAYRDGHAILLCPDPACDAVVDSLYAPGDR